METYIKIPIEASNRYTYIPCSKILQVSFALDTGYDVIYVRMKGGPGIMGYRLLLDDADQLPPTTAEECQSILFEFNKIISSKPGGGVVKLGGRFNNLLEPPEYTDLT